MSTSSDPSRRASATRRVDRAASSSASANRGLRSRITTSASEHQAGGAGGRLAEPDLVGDRPLEHRAERVQRAEDHHEHAHHPPADRGRRAELGDALKLESAPR